jgi:hypothetical protein
VVVGGAVLVVEVVVVVVVVVVEVDVLVVVVGKTKILVVDVVSKVKTPAGSLSSLGSIFCTQF